MVKHIGEGIATTGDIVIGDGHTIIGGPSGGSGKVYATKVVKAGTDDGTADYYCDGTNDEVQIQAAIDAVGALGGGKVLIRRGSYNIGARIDLDSDNVHISGEGNATVLNEVAIPDWYWIFHHNANNLAITDLKMTTRTTRAAVGYQNMSILTETRYIDFWDASNEQWLSFSIGPGNYQPQYVCYLMSNIFESLYNNSVYNRTSVRFDRTTGKYNITVLAGGPLTIGWKTGPHGSDNTGDNLGALLGFNTTSDTTSSSFVSNNAMAIHSGFYMNNVFVQAVGNQGSINLVDVNDVIIENSTVLFTTTASAGFWGTGRNVTIKNCSVLVSGSGVGAIGLSNCFDSKIIGCTGVFNINIDSAVNITVADNITRGGYIYIYDTSSINQIEKLNIFNNTIISNGTALTIITSSALSWNTPMIPLGAIKISNNYLSGTYGILIDWSYPQVEYLTDVTIENNRIKATNEEIYVNDSSMWNSGFVIHGNNMKGSGATFYSDITLQRKDNIDYDGTWLGEV